MILHNTDRAATNRVYTPAWHERRRVRVAALAALWVATFVVSRGVF